MIDMMQDIPMMTELRVIIDKGRTGDMTTDKMIAGTTDMKDLVTGTVM